MPSFEIKLNLFYILKCTAFVCNWPLCHHLRSSSTLESSLLGCYVLFCMFALLGGVTFKELLSRGIICFETLLKLFCIPKCTACVFIIGLCVTTLNPAEQYLLS